MICKVSFSHKTKNLRNMYSKRVENNLKAHLQLARRLVGGQLQQITYKEYLPLILGKDALLGLDSDETNYDPSVDPSILNEFATVAFRWQKLKGSKKILSLVV